MLADSVLADVITVEMRLDAVNPREVVGEAQKRVGSTEIDVMKEGQEPEDGSDLERPFAPITLDQCERSPPGPRRSRRTHLTSPADRIR